VTTRSSTTPPLKGQLGPASVRTTADIEALTGMELQGS